MQGLRVLMLGRPRLEFDGQPLTQYLAIKAQALVYFLAATGEAQPRALLAGLLWGELPEDSARANLRLALSRLRKAVGDALLAEGATLRINPAVPLYCDLHLLRAAASDRLPADEAEAAAALCRGPLLDGFEVPGADDFEHWLRRERDRTARAAIGLWRAAAEGLAAAGQIERAIEAARRWLALDEADEDAHRTLIGLLARAGRRTAAIAQYETCRRILVETLGAKPSAPTFELYRRIHAEAAPELRAAAPVAVPQPGSPKTPGLPEPCTPLLGRERELAEIGERLLHADCRVLTLTGPGGIGKTRLALAAAAAAAPRFPDGAAFVHAGYEQETPAADPVGRLLARIATVLGLKVSEAQPARDTLLLALAGRRLLLVLDNLESAPGAGRVVSALADAAPGVKLLATSRARLGSAREWLYDVPGLAVDGPDPAAVRLFAQCARRLRADFDIAREGEAVRAICRSLEGMPLAIELAAQWVRALTCASIAEQLARDARLLESREQGADPRHAGMQRVIGDSWRRLSESSRAAALRLAIFHGGFDEVAARAVAGVETAELGELADQSWLRRRDDGRLGMHALLLQFARARLAEDEGLRDELRRRHRAHFVALMRRLGPQSAGPDAADAVVRLDRDADNLREAGRASLEAGDREEVFGLLEAAWPYLRRKGMYQEAARIFEQAQAIADATVWQRSLWALRGAACRYQLCQAERANEAYERAFLMLGIRRLDDPVRTAADSLRARPWRRLASGREADPAARPARAEALQAIAFLGQMAAFIGERPRSMSLLVLARSLPRAALGGEERSLVDSCLCNIFGAIPLRVLAQRYARTAVPPGAGEGALSAIAGEFVAVYRWQNAEWDDCLGLLRAAAARFREHGYSRNYFETLSLIGKLHYVRGRYPEAAEHFASLLREALAAGHGPAEHWGLIGLTEAMLRTGGADTETMARWMARAKESMAGLETTDRAYVIRWHGVSASVALRAGDLEAARATALVGARAISRARLAGMWSYEGFGGVVEALLACLRADRAAGRDPARIESALAESLRGLRRHALRYRAMRPRMLLYSAAVQALSGRARRARATLRKALALSRRLDMRCEEARALEQMAALAEDPEEGRRRLDEASAAYADCGARADVMRCAALLAGAGAGAPATNPGAAREPGSA